MDNLTTEHYKVLILEKLNKYGAQNPNGLGIKGLSKKLGLDICAELEKEHMVNSQGNLIVINQGGKDYLEQVSLAQDLINVLRDEIAPTNTPANADKNTQGNTKNKGMFFDKKSESEFIVGFVYAILALLIGSIILKILNVI